VNKPIKFAQVITDLTKVNDFQLVDALKEVTDAASLAAKFPYSKLDVIAQRVRAHAQHFNPADFAPTSGGGLNINDVALALESIGLKKDFAVSLAHQMSMKSVAPNSMTAFEDAFTEAQKVITAHLPVYDQVIGSADALVTEFSELDRALAKASAELKALPDMAKTPEALETALVPLSRHAFQLATKEVPDLLKTVAPEMVASHPTYLHNYGTLVAAAARYAGLDDTKVENILRAAIPKAVPADIANYISGSGKYMSQRVSSYASLISSLGQLGDNHPLPTAAAQTALSSAPVAESAAAESIVVRAAGTIATPAPSAAAPAPLATAPAVAPAPSAAASATPPEAKTTGIGASTITDPTRVAAAESAPLEFNTTGSPSQSASLPAELESNPAAGSQETRAIISEARRLSAKEAMTPFKEGHNPLETKYVRMPLEAEKLAALEEKAIQSFVVGFQNFHKGKVLTANTYDHLLNEVKLAVVAQLRSAKPELLNTPFSEISKLPDFGAAYSNLYERALIQAGMAKSGDNIEQVAADIRRRINGETTFKRGVRVIRESIQGLAEKYPTLGRLLKRKPDAGAIPDSHGEFEEARLFEELKKDSSPIQTVEGETQTFQEIDVQHLDVDLEVVENRARQGLNNIYKARIQSKRLGALFDAACGELFARDELKAIASLSGMQPASHLHSLIRATLLNDPNPIHQELTSRYFAPDVIEHLRAAAQQLTGDGTLDKLKQLAESSDKSEELYTKLYEAFMERSPSHGAELIKKTNAAADKYLEENAHPKPMAAAAEAAAKDAQLTTKASFEKLVELQKHHVLAASKLDEACAKLLDHPMVTEHMPELSAFTNPQERAEFLSELFSGGTSTDRFKALKETIKPVEFNRLHDLAHSPEFAEVRKLIEPELSALHEVQQTVGLMMFKLKSHPGIKDIYQFSEKALDEARALLLREEVAAGRLALPTAQTGTEAAGRSPAASEQAAPAAAEHAAPPAAPPSEPPAAPATAEHAVPPATPTESSPKIEAATAKVESTLAAEKSWLTRMGETVMANKGKTAVATLAAAGLSYAAYEALKRDDKKPSALAGRE
jgi:hypothetical protein